VSVAEEFEAHLLGVAFSYEPVIPGAVMGGIPADFIERQRSEADKKATTAVTRFEQLVKREGISFERRSVSASIAGASDQLARMARRFDLVVVGQAERGKPMPEEVVDEGVLFESGRPVIFVPFIQKAGLKLDRVLLAWDGGRPAARAVGDAMPFLEKAKQVEVVIVGNKPPKSDEVSGADLGEHLARHAIKTTVKRITAPDSNVGSVILSHAADSDADMIVMGGYGHSRLREFVLGGVTRGLLESMTVPLLMSH
jgi:nucleotide-binding universal stress UspA family protein